MSLEQARARIARSEAAFAKREGINFVIIDKKADKLMGWIGYWLTPSHSAAIGFWLATPFQGHGFITEAAAATVPPATSFLGANILQGTASLDNPPSVRVLTNLGMTLTHEAIVHFHVPNKDHLCGIYERVLG